MSRPILTERDDTMLRLLAQGLSARAIADHVGLTYGTVRVYLCQLYERIGVANKTQAALWYAEREHRARAKTARSACLEHFGTFKRSGVLTHAKRVC
jgi:DNA-binding CsgD family transcriptional regulator